MDLYDAYGCRINPRVDCGQQEEHTDPAQNQTTTKPAEPPQRPITLNHLVNTKNGQPDSYEEKNYRLQKRGLWIQALLCFFTALAFVAAAYYAYIANRQLEEIRIQNVAQQRAILVVSQSP